MPQIRCCGIFQACWHSVVQAIMAQVIDNPGLRKRTQDTIIPSFTRHEGTAREGNVDTSNSIPGDLVFEAVIKGKTGHIERKVIPCVDHERRLTRLLTAFCNCTTATKEIQHVPSCTANFRSIHQNISDRLGVIGEDISGHDASETH